MGTSMLNGNVNPSTLTGNDGDFYINTATNELFGPKANGTWPAGVSLIGAIGPQGVTGPQGIQFRHDWPHGYLGAQTDLFEQFRCQFDE